jgi:RNA polymerase sigma factor (sigma-70 family)
MRTDEGSSSRPASDRRLLGKFVDHGDENAFAELVSRYCGLVMGVCRRFSHGEQAAEDAFQATFMVLARRASRIRDRSSLGGWLYAVAYRVARRASGERFRRREEPLPSDMTTNDDTLAQVASRYEQQLVDEELNRLPARYCQPLVLRYLLGKSNKEVASELGLALGVVEGRLKRGKDRLRVRLARRGVGLAVAVAAVGGSAVAAEAAAGESLINATVEAASAFRRGTPPVGDHSQTAIHLAEKELAMSITTATASTVSAVVLTAGLVVGLAANGVQKHALAQAPPLQATAAAPSAELADDENPPPAGLAAQKEPQAANDPFGVDPKTAAILKALEQPSEAEFLDTPLPGALAQLSSIHSIEIEVDADSLKAAGVPPDAPVTLSVKAVPLKTTLENMLGQHQLTYKITPRGLLVTAAKQAAELRLGISVDSLIAIDVKERGTAERRIITALKEQARLEFIETPLQEIVDFLKDFHGIEIQLDLKALGDVGLMCDTPITKNLKGLQLKSALGLLLRDLDLTFVVTDEVLLITTPEVAESMLETHVYTLEQLPGFDPNELAEVIRSTIRPDTWRDAVAFDEAESAAAGSAKPARRTAIQSLPGCLVVTQTQRAHEEIEELLRQLAKLPARPASQ